MIDAPSRNQALLNGVRLTCPRCGEGKLFSSYLKRVDACSHCGESFEGLDADDGPAWLTIGLTVPMLIGSLLYLELRQDLPAGEEALILVAAAISSVLLLLPVAKGFFIGLLWLARREG